MIGPGTRRGLNALEVIVAVAVVGGVALVLMIAMPRGREAARRASCQRNLMQVGMALGLYHEAVGSLPTVHLGGEGPLAAMLGELGQADLQALNDRKLPPPKASAGPPAERPIRGFICPSDPNASAGTHPAPVSYRATTGSATDGQGGPFAIGKRVTLAEVEAADGVSYTAAFSERLVGHGASSPDPLAGYHVVPGPIPPSGCPTSGPKALRGDAGSSWARADWRTTISTHASSPNRSPSCIAADGRTALMGASSGHPDGVHVLLLDGSLKAIRPSVAPEVWKSLATVGEPPR